MRKKRIPPSEPIIAGEILAKAKQAIHADKLPTAKPAKCEVCGSDCIASAEEQLCWVCRRLKISAWHESEQQMPVQE